MHSSVLFAAFAAVALASPLVDKRGEVVVTDAEVVYVTQFVTFTEGQVAPTAPFAEPTGHRKKGYGGWRKGRGRKTGGYGTAPAPAPTNPVPASEAPAPSPSTFEPAPEPQPNTDAPAPAPTPDEQPAPAPIPDEQPAPKPQSTTEAPAPAPPAYTPPASGKATTYQQAVVQHHNYHRANHSCPDLVWSQSLANTAMKIAKTCVYEHSMEVDGGNYGQNIAAGVLGQKISSVITDMFYNGEIAAYGSQFGINPSMSNFMEWGHLSQVVWKGTTEVGCATYSCGDGGLQKATQTNGYYTVCNYKEAGNMQGAFDINVPATLNQPTIGGDHNIDQEAIAKSIGETYQPPSSGGYGGYGKH